MGFNIPLPIEPLYCPKLTCFVYDNIFMGASQALIGVFTLPIGDLMVQLKEERKIELDAIQNICFKLEEFLKSGGELEPKSYSNKLRDSNISGPSLNSTEIRHESASDSDMEGLLSDKGKRKSNKAMKKSLESGSIKPMNAVTMTVIKKQVNKGLKGSQMGKDKDFREEFGASEEGGNVQAFNRQDNLKDQIKQRMDKIRKRDSINEPENSNNRRGTVRFNRKKSKSSIEEEGQISESHMNYRQLSKKEKVQAMMDDKAQLARIDEEDRIRAEEKLIEEGVDITSVIKMPKYVKDQRLKVDKETSVPDEHLYIGLGWDEDDKTLRKHYRQFYNDELENIKSIFPKPSPFNTYVLKKG